MATKIFSADVIIGEGKKQKTITNIPVKRLPIYVLVSDTNFVNKLMRYIGEQEWFKMPIDKKTRLPKIEIKFKNYLGQITKEPIL